MTFFQSIPMIPSTLAQSVTKSRPGRRGRVHVNRNLPWFYGRTRARRVLFLINRNNWLWIDNAINRKWTNQTKTYVLLRPCLFMVSSFLSSSARLLTSITTLCLFAVSNSASRWVSSILSCGLNSKIWNEKMKKMKIDHFSWRMRNPITEGMTVCEGVLVYV